MASIPALETTSIPAIPTAEPTISLLESVPVTTSVPIPPSAVPSDFPENVSDIHQTAVAPSSNPEILRFVKMLAFGVPLMAVEQKMLAEGYDPSLLNSTKVNVTKAPAPRSKSSSSDDEELNSDEY